MKKARKGISVVIPTYCRPAEIAEAVDNLSQQRLLPVEVVIVDGATENDNRTETAIRQLRTGLPFQIRYLRRQGGTALQRNAGIDLAEGEFIALIDDDIRLEPDFFEKIRDVFQLEGNTDVGGVVGYRTNQHFSADESERWRWYKRLSLLSTYEPGRYDYRSGYPINSNLQPPFTGTCAIDFMTTACAVWRREVFDSGLRFDPFFTDYGVLEDAHFSLRAERDWRLLQSGDAKCVELRSPNGRVSSRKIGYKSVVNYYYVFSDIAAPLSMSQKLRFWRFQAFEFIRLASSLVRRRRSIDLQQIAGRIEGVLAVMRGLEKSADPTRGDAVVPRPRQFETP